MLLYHADMPWLPGGFLGVEVFFVISGYLITLLLSQEFTRRHGISLGQFWLRRARRLLAALYTLLAVVSVVVLVFYREDADELAGQVWAALTYVTNWFLIVIDQSYFATVERPMVFQHLWSLAIEEQFYLVWPVLLLVLLRVSRGRQWAVGDRRHARGDRLAGVDGGAVRAGDRPQPRVLRHRHPGGRPAARRRAGPGVEADAHVAARGRRRGQDGRPRPRRDGGVGVLVACFAEIRETDTFLYRGGFAVVSRGVVRGDRGHRAPAARCSGAHVLGRPVLTWIGKRSYSLYLWHWPIFVYTRPEIDQPLGLYADAGAAPRADRDRGRAELPLRRGADPQRRLRPVAAPARPPRTAPAAAPVRSPSPRRPVCCSSP